MGTGDNTSTHIDKSIIYLFIGAFLISATTLAYRYVNHTPCDTVSFTHTAKQYRVGGIIKFKDGSQGVQERKWDFGDGSVGSFLKEPFHTFDEEGEYQVRLLINGSCTKVQTIEIKEKQILIDSTKFPVFELPESIQLGEKLEVRDITQNATTWEWRFGETASINAKTRTAEYVYEEIGLKTVSLIVNGNLRYVTKKKIQVIPVPEKKERPKVDYVKKLSTKPPEMKESLPDKPPAPSPVHFITENDFELKIMAIAEGQKNIEGLSKYFCGNVTSTMVVVNDKDSMTFDLFCEEIREKNIKIKSLKLNRDEGSTCIKNVAISYRKKWF